MVRELLTSYRREAQIEGLFATVAIGHLKGHWARRMVAARRDAGRGGSRIAPRHRRRRRSWIRSGAMSVANNGTRRSRSSWRADEGIRCSRGRRS
jgi:hypothetical protein